MRTDYSIESFAPCCCVVVVRNPATVRQVTIPYNAREHARRHANLEANGIQVRAPSRTDFTTSGEAIG